MIQIQIFKRFDLQSPSDDEISEYWTFKKINSPVIRQLQSDCGDQ
jgi:hypothetical protein